MDVTLALQDLKQRPYTLDVLIHEGTVELRHRSRLLGSVVREVLRAYLRAPIGEFAYDRTRWIEHKEDLWLCIDNEVIQPLTPDQVTELRSNI